VRGSGEFDRSSSGGCCVALKALKVSLFQRRLMYHFPVRQSSPFDAKPPANSLRFSIEAGLNCGHQQYALSSP
jgi:hypothetical protein